MTDPLDELAKLLAMGDAQKQAIASSDPYLQFKQAPDLVSQVLLQNAGNPNWSIQDKIVAGLLSGGVSGLFGGLSSDYQARAQDAYTDVLGKRLLGQQVERPRVLNPSIFNMAEQQADIFKLQRAMQIGDEKRKQGIETRAKATDKLLETALTSDYEPDRAMARQALQGVDPDLYASMFGAASAGSSVEAGTPETSKGQPVEMSDTISVTENPNRMQELITKYGGDRKMARTMYEAEEKAKIDKDKQGWFDKSPAAVQTKLLQADSATKALADLADRFAEFSKNPLVFGAKAKFAQTDEYKAVGQLKLMIPVVTRLSGEVGNLAEQEQARALAATLGNVTAGGPDTAALVLQAAELYRSLALRQAETAKDTYSGSGDGIINSLKQPLSGGTPATQSTTPTKADIIAELQRRGVKIGE